MHTASNCWKPKPKGMVISSEAVKGTFNDYPVREYTSSDVEAALGQKWFEI